MIGHRQTLISENNGYSSQGQLQDQKSSYLILFYST